MAIMSNEEYENYEIRRFHSHVQLVGKQPRQWLKENQAEFMESCVESPEIIAERAGWILGGTHGFGAFKAAWQVVESRKGVSRRAWFFNIVAALEYGTPKSRANAVWHSLTQEQRDNLDRLIDAELDRVIANTREESERFEESQKANKGEEE